MKDSYIGSFSRVVFMGQDWTWHSKSDNSPCHLHPLSSWQQNTRSLLTWRRNFLSNIVSKCGSLHSGHPLFSFCILVAACCEKWLPQQAVRWGWSSRPYVMGQKTSSDGCSTKGNSSSADGDWDFLNIMWSWHDMNEQSLQEVLRKERQQQQHNRKAKQHNTTRPKQSFFEEKLAALGGTRTHDNQLSRLCSYQLRYRGSSVGWARYV